jgi:hypothetical protein
MHATPVEYNTFNYYQTAGKKALISTMYPLIIVMFVHKVGGQFTVLALPRVVYLDFQVVIRTNLR